MIEKETKRFLIHEEDVPNLLKELEHWDIVPTNPSDREMTFEIQSNNTLVTVELLISERGFLSELMSVDTFVRSFKDIQVQTFGKEIWNWR